MMLHDFFNFVIDGAELFTKSDLNFSVREKSLTAENPKI
jgi:hypothetical protein